MRRLQLFEFHDYPWYPEALRDAQREILDLGNKVSGFCDAIARPYAEAITASGAKAVLDLCSGAGGPMVEVQRVLVERGLAPPPILLSDRFPDEEALDRARRSLPEHIDFVREPVDATAVPRHLRGDLVTVINALHHFPPETVQAILADAVARGASLFVAEAFPRSLIRASVYFWPLLGSLPRALLTTRHLKATKILSLPALLLFGGWDWFASALRIHEPSELLPVGRRLAPHYQWTAGHVNYGGWGRAVYLMGIAPQRDSQAEEQGLQESEPGDRSQRT